MRLDFALGCGGVGVAVTKMHSGVSLITQLRIVDLRRGGSNASAIAHVVGEDNDEVGLFVGRIGSGQCSQRREQQGGEEGENGFHGD